jgi:hypothetical protein
MRLRKRFGLRRQGRLISVVSKRYPCLVPTCNESAAWMAKDNHALYGHICTDCHNELSLREREEYAHEIEASRPKGASIYWPYEV